MFKFIFLLSCFFLTSVFAQTLSNIDFFAEGKKVIVTYDLSDCEPGEFYDVSLNFVEQSTLKVTVPKTISGDVKKITCGSKRIVWDIGADVSSLSGRFYPELEVKKADNSTADISNVTDIDGNTYKVVKIGNQVWMTENLKTVKYNDGTLIPNIIDNNQWRNLTTGAWCYYDNYAAHNAKYGKLYNWYAVSKTTNGNKNICPIGWHIPTYVEWKVLTEYLGGESAAIDKMIEVGNSSWVSPNTDATNSSMFTGLPGGARNVGGDYSSIGSGGYWWSSTQDDIYNAWSRCLAKDSWSSIIDYLNNKHFGFSVRCLKDDDDNSVDNFELKEIEVEVDEEASFPGGPEALNRWISKDLIYPESAFEKQGTVYVSFVVEPDGSTSNIFIKKGVSDEIDREVIRFIKSMPKWRAAKKNGRAVRTSFVMPFRFVNN
jgi:TonB family protein